MEFPCDLVVTDLGPDRLKVVSFLRQLLHLDLVQAKDLASTMPIKVAHGSFANLGYLNQQLKQLGATIAFRDCTCEYHTPDPIPPPRPDGGSRFMPGYLFVYGTLKRRSRHPMARQLADRARRYLGPARIAARLYDLGRFPGLKPAQAPDDWVQGDLYDIGCGDSGDELFREMDAYENAEAPTAYERRPSTVFLDDGRSLAVWVYWYRGDVREEAFIASGSFEENCDP